ncbi:MAG: ABC transporter permease [Planctomycetes bacterium]|nr:ABC transporter permease [Planctomycetota bacterium]
MDKLSVFHLRIILMALKGLRQNLLRSMLATLGVIIGVGAVVSAVSILEGAQRDILERFEALGADQVIIVNGSEHRHGRSVSLNSLTPNDAKLIQRENPTLVKAVAPQFQGGGQIKYFEKNVVASVLGTSEGYAAMNSYEVVNGRFLRRADIRGTTMVCILGHKVAKDLFGWLSPVDKKVKINGKSFIVVGVMEEKGTLGFMEVDNQVIIPLSTAMGRMFGSRNLTMLVVQAVSAKKLSACIQGVKKTLRGSHRIKPGTADDFQIFTQEQMKQQFAQVAQIFAVVLYSIAGISMVVGGIGIMNIMLVSVTERTREIGVRMAVGARRFDILEQFLMEASTISVLGGALGVVCGWAMASFLGSYTQVFKTYTPPIIIVLALIMAFIIGIVSGIYPAIRAARLDPVESLRYE